MSKDQLKEERLKILEMLSNGTIDAKQAEELLSALGHKEVEATFVEKKKGPFKLLKILVDSADGDKVNIKIPVEFAKLLKNKKFQANFGDVDVDVDSIIEMVTQGMEGEIVNVESSDGDTVKIVVE
eukprot:Anaeramoba_ignava/c18487_g1_i1.p2 GENE.c18487_g1_i1~~c18487_g1_i1.p2  ORF type:complete len:126 (+),score=29.89 c18487_g1_i1:1264-1641(+)